MNNMEMITKVSEKSGVSTEDCQMVLKALEDVLSEELINSKDVGKAFDKIYKLLSFFSNKK
ncbi:HU family DNA-binding protein [Niallia circulans]|jgi:nucleoid DNA-binding protein|uniref:HU family DNA-binding protein n=1 Tax=Niallia circulans TaxID=1397 RepID=UPI001560C538|nr:HU family DNA-binding protein [Niallia circulans]NRG33467.1 HU family DNA-binding protein [Niallia circulans]